MNKYFNKTTYFVLLIIFFIFLSCYFVPKYFISSTKNQIYSNSEQIPVAQVGLVLGARVYNNGQPSPVLKDRLLSAIELYKKDKFSIFLLSGDNGQVEYNEVQAMKEFLLTQGISEDIIFLDHAGFDTYDSIYRARDIFQVNSIIIFTQDFHLPRAVFIANALDVQAYGYISDRQLYQQANYQNRREFFAQFKALLDIYTFSKPTYLGDIIELPK